MNKPDSSKLEKVIDEQMESAYFVGKNCIGFPEEVKARIKRKIIALFEKQFNPDYLDFKKGVKATEVIWKVKVKEAKREAEERIQEIYEGEWVDVEDVYCPSWVVNARQALKGGK